MKYFSQLSLFSLIVGTSFSISACGQKGPLVAPVKPPAVSTPYPVAMPKQGEQAKEAY